MPADDHGKWSEMWIQPMPANLSFSMFDEFHSNYFTIARCVPLSTTYLCNVSSPQATYWEHGWVLRWRRERWACWLFPLRPSVHLFILSRCLPWTWTLSTGRFSFDLVFVVVVLSSSHTDRTQISEAFNGSCVLRLRANYSTHGMYCLCWVSNDNASQLCFQRSSLVDTDWWEIESVEMWYVYSWHQAVVWRYRLDQNGHIPVGESKTLLFSDTSKVSTLYL